MVHTALHGVGSDTLLALFERAGFPPPHQWPSQQHPDADFPTVSFPNPEEPGAIDAALELARESSPDLVLANDPDADRCAVAIADRGDWRMLRGDEVGALLGAHILCAEAGHRCRLRELDRVLAPARRDGAKAGIRHEETLTGFKWIARVAGLRYGYEEALGYCVDPGTVRDKDGVSAALLIAEMAPASRPRAARSPTCSTTSPSSTGVHATDSFSVRVADLSLDRHGHERLRESARRGRPGSRWARRRPLGR